MICPRCGANAADGKNFCGDCGASLPWRCRACGDENQPGKRFCGECGAPRVVATSAGEPISAALAPSPTPAPSPDADPAAVERRQLSIVFVDLVGSTEIGARLDPEDLRSVIAAYYDAVNDVVTKYHGFVGRYLGDGVLVYFGYPKAEEDDAERAIRAGLAVTEAVSRLRTMAGPVGTLKARVGISTGVVVVGDLIGSGASLESSVVGDTPNVAARLQTFAEPGTVVISEDTRRLVGRLFEYRDLGGVALKGVPGPVQAWAVLRESVIDSRFEALRSGEVPLIGRGEELELLLRRWEQARTGEGRVILLAGEPGIGKSRLVTALEREARSVAHACLRFTCSPHHQDAPLQPIIGHLERNAGLQTGDPMSAKQERLKQYLPPGTTGLDFAIFADLLSIGSDGHETTSNLSPQRRREMTLGAILRYFAALAGNGPLLAVFEDIHWADPSTLEVLAELAELTEKLPDLLVATTRGDPPSWVSRPHVSVQLLNGLNRREATDLIQAMLINRTIREDVVERILARADGIPLFIEELTQAVLDKSLDALSPEMVPTSLNASLMARLDRLGAGKEAAQVGAVIGRDFSFAAVESLSNLPRAKLEEGLRALVQRGLASAHGEPPHATYTFKHALVQDAAYSSLLRERRRSLHLRFAEMLEQDPDGPASTQPDLLAWHFAQAGSPERAIDYYLKAAERGTGRSALAEIVSHLRKGLEQLKLLPDSPETRERELSLQVALARALIDYKGSGSAEVRVASERARELCLTLDSPRHFIQVHDGLFNHHFTHSEPHKVLEYGEELLQLGKRTGDPQALLMAHRSAAQANLLLGHFEAAREAGESLLAIYDAKRDGGAALTSRDPRVSTCTMLGICLTALGDPVRGAATAREGLAHGERLEHTVSLVLGLRRACVQAMIQGNAAAARELSERLMALNAKYETYLGGREGTIFRNWALLQERHDPALMDTMQASLDELDRANHRVLLPFFMTAAAELKGAHGDAAGALHLLERAAELVATTGERWHEPELLRVKASLMDGDAEARAALLGQAMGLARRQGARLWELRAAMGLAQIHAERQETAVARQALEPVSASFQDGVDFPELRRGREFLASLDRG